MKIEEIKAHVQKYKNDHAVKQETQKFLSLFDNDTALTNYLIKAYKVPSEFVMQAFEECDTIENRNIILYNMAFANFMMNVRDDINGEHFSDLDRIIQLLTEYAIDFYDLAILLTLANDIKHTGATNEHQQHLHMDREI